MATLPGPGHPWAWLLATSVGLTCATNAIGGNASAPGLLVAVGGSAAVLLVGYVALGLR